MLKRGGANGVNDKTPLKALGERLQHQETRRLANIGAARATECSIVPPDTVGVPGHLLGAWTRKGLKLLGAQAQLAGLGGVAKYWAWQVQPQAGSGATAAWVVQRAGAAADGRAHRVRVVHRIDGRMICTCWVWEVWGVECRHCLALHGCVDESSAHAFWRQGTSLGANDDLLLGESHRPHGPLARQCRLHCAGGATEEAPSWAVRFYERHAEVVESNTGAAAAPAQIGPAVPPTRAAQTPDGNYAIGQKMGAIFGRLQAMAASSSTKPADAARLLGMAEQMERDAIARLSASPSITQGLHRGAAVVTSVREARPGPGSSKRKKGAYDKH